MKYIEVHLQTNKVHRVEDVLPSNSAEAAKFIECSNDAVEMNWWVDPADGSLHTQRRWDREEAREERDKMLKATDWMMASDFAIHKPEHAAALADLKTYRQALRDMMSNDPILQEHFPLWPSSLKQGNF